MQPIVVVAHARSGSNCLVDLLDLALPTGLLNEPFNEHHHTWGPEQLEWLPRVVDAASLDEVVDEIFRSWPGFKVLGYQLPPALLEHLLLRADIRVVRLRRRNLLATAVSSLVAQQTGIWRAPGVVGALEDHYRDLAPLPFDEVRRLLVGFAAEADAIDEVLDRREGPTLRLVHEALYVTDTAASVAALWRFLDVEPPADDLVAHCLDPARVQLGRPDTYGRVPNIAEIEATFGSDDVGHLTYV